MASRSARTYAGYFTVWPRDQAYDTWVLFRQVKPPPPKLQTLGPTYYRLLGNPVAPGGIEARSRYLDVVCPTCGGYDPYEAFRLGFDQDITVRMNGDFGFSRDNVFLINRKMLGVLRSEGVGGFEVKPVGSDGWVALLITFIVAASPRPLRRVGESCVTCGRPQEVFGIYTRLSEITPPQVSNTFFTVNRRRIHHFPRSEAREILVTGDVVAALKRHRIKGDSCHRLLTEDEAREVMQRQKAGHHEPLPGTCILLY